MKVILAPIDPPAGDRCWSVRAVNDGPDPIASLVLERVDYEWGDQGNERTLGTRFGPIAPGAEVEIYRETDTEVRTSLTLAVDGRRCYAELGKLRAPSGQPPRTIVPQPLNA